MSTRGYLIKGTLLVAYSCTIGTMVYSYFWSEADEQKNSRNPQPSISADVASFLVDSGLLVAQATGATYVASKLTNWAYNYCCPADGGRSRAPQRTASTSTGYYPLDYLLGSADAESAAPSVVPRNRGYKFIKESLDVVRACNYSMAPVILLRYIPVLGTYPGVAIGKGLFLFTPVTSVAVIFGIGAAEIHKWREQRKGKTDMSPWDFIVPIFGMSLSGTISTVTIRNAKNGGAQVSGEVISKLPLILTPAQNAIASLKCTASLLSRIKGVIASCAGGSGNTIDNRQLCGSCCAGGCNCCTTQVVVHHHSNSVF